MKKKRIAFSMVLFLCMTFLFGCTKANEAGASKGTKVTLNEVAHSCFYAPLYVAMEEGYFDEEGIALELVTGFGADN